VGLLHIQLKQIVDVTETLGAQRYAIFQQSKLSAGTRTRVDGGTYRREVFLSRAPVYPNTRYAIEHFTGVGGCSLILI
jgi:hypothetical protein